MKDSAIVSSIVSCSWCHEANEITAPGEHFCAHCGHRADVARGDCNCASCRNPISVGDDFPRQQTRCRELLQAYKEIGPAGAFGAVLIEAALKRADAAAISGDVLAILRGYDELKGFE